MNESNKNNSNNTTDNSTNGAKIIEFLLYASHSSKCFS